MPPLSNILKRLFGYKDSKDIYLALPPYAPVYANPDLSRIRNPDPRSVQITWVGHSTFLIQVAGINLLTDPIWSERASPVAWAGPRRRAHPGLAFENLPKIDAVLLSHTHYDHLDRPTIQRLGNMTRYFVQERTKWWFSNERITNVSELTWWQSEAIDGLTITAVPVQHWSKRGFFRTNEAGWGGFVVQSPAGTIFFAGDTGYRRDYFKTIGERFPGIRLALIPIGAYAPRWFMHGFHVDPGEAVHMHRDLGAQQSIGMHWGTFNLSDEPLGEPPLLLAREAASAGLAAEDFSTMKIGETRTIS